ncbi:MAG: hypothetical protein B6D36_06425 [Planctomycetes bacterium UTPLA1]|nr:MAG: hypothetical protein B6D36_06425 [Planctomycetes bacterium UTPLA1]
MKEIIMKRSLATRLVKSKMLMPLLVGGMALQFNLGGCDAEVRDSVLTGLSTSLTTLASAVINAFFLSLGDASTTSQPVVQAAFEIIQSLPA